MKRLFEHLLQILCLGIIFFFMVKVPLYQVPYIQQILSTLIVILICICGYLLFLKRPAKSAKKRKRTLAILLILGGLLFSRPLYADSFCSWAETYDQQTFKARMNKWKGDRPCEESQRESVRVKLNDLKRTPSVFIRTDKLTAKEQKTWRSFRAESHWSEWVAQNFSELGMDAEEMACAAVLSSLCSEYERRHPDTRAKTVGQIMQMDEKDSGCWPCKMAYITLTVVQSMSADLEENMREAGVNILKIFMLLWILYSAFLVVVFPSKGSAFLKNLITRLLCVMIAAMILSSGDTLRNLYSSVLSPIVSLGLGLTKEISNSIDDSAFSFAKDVRSDVGIGSVGVDYCAISVVGSAGTQNNPYAQAMRSEFPHMGSTYPKLGNVADALITPELQAHLLCLTQTMYRQVSPITAVGQSLISFSLADGIISFGFSLSKMSMWLVGATLLILFSVFSFLVAFKIIDIFLKLGFVLVLVPIFVATWAFPVTRDFTKKGFMFLMNIISEFLGLVLALNFIMMTFEVGITDNKDSLIKAIIGKVGSPYGYYKGYGANLYNVVTSNGGWYFVFMLVALFFMGTQLLSVCTKVIASFFGTGDAASVGGDITGAVAVSMAKMAGTVGKKGWDTGSFAAKNAESYHDKEWNSVSYGVGRAVGRVSSRQNPFKDVPNPFKDETSSGAVAAPKRYFGDHAAGAVDRFSQNAAKGIDRIGVTAGQWFQKKGIGALVGVPLTLGTKTLTTGIRAVGKVTSGIMRIGGIGYAANKKIVKGGKRGTEDGKK